MLHALLRNLIAKITRRNSQANAHKKRPTARLALESLEAREVLNGDTAVASLGDSLTFSTGTQDSLGAFTLTDSSVAAGQLTVGTDFLRISGNPTLRTASLLPQLSAPDLEQVDAEFNLENAVVTPVAILDIFDQVSRQLGQLRKSSPLQPELTLDPLQQSLPFTKNLTIDDTVNLSELVDSRLVQPLRTELEQTNEDGGTVPFDSSDLQSFLTSRGLLGSEGLRFDPTNQELTIHLRIVGTGPTVESDLFFEDKTNELKDLEFDDAKVNFTTTATIDIKVVVAFRELGTDFVFDQDTLLADLNAGSGVPGLDSDNTVLRVTLDDDTSFDVDLIGVTTVGDVANRIEAASGKVSVVVNQIEKRFELHPQTNGPKITSVLPVDSSRAVLGLGITVESLVPEENGVVLGGPLHGDSFVNLFSVTAPRVDLSTRVLLPSSEIEAQFGLLDLDLDSVALNETIDLSLSAANPSDRTSVPELGETLAANSELTGEVDLDLTPQPVDFGIDLRGSQVVVAWDSAIPDSNDLTLNDGVTSWDTVRKIDVNVVEQATDQVLAFLDEVDKQSVFATTLPVLNRSVADVLDLSSTAWKLRTELSEDPPETLQQVQDQVRSAFGNSASLSLQEEVVEITVPYDFQKAFEFRLDEQFGEDFDNLVGFGVSTPVLANIESTGTLDFQVDLSQPTPEVALKNSSRLDFEIRIDAEDISLNANTGILNVFIDAGVIRLDDGAEDKKDAKAATFSVSLQGLADQSTKVKDILSAPDTHLASQANGKLDIQLPTFFPTRNNPQGNIEVTIESLTDLGTVAPDVTVPDFSGATSNLDLSDTLDNLVDGFDRAIQVLENALSDQLVSVDIPLVGDQLDNVGDFLRDLREDVTQEIASLTHVTDVLIREKLFEVLGSPGLEWLGDLNDDGSVDASDILITPTEAGDGFEFEFDLQQSLVSTGLAIDVGLDAIGLEIEGSLDLDVTFDMHFGFGISTSEGFYLTTEHERGDNPDAPELELTLEVSLAPEDGDPDGLFDAQAQLGFLKLTATDVSNEDGKHTHLSGTVAVNLDDDDGKLTLSEMTSFSKLKDSLDVSFEASAYIGLDLVSSLGSSNLPSFGATFVTDWQYESGSDEFDLTVSLNDVYMDPGDFIKDTVAKIKDVLEPVIPIAQVLNTRIPLISDLEGRDVTFLDLAEFLGGRLSPTSREFVEKVIDFIEFADNLEDFTGEIHFGSMDIFSSSNNEADSPEQLAESLANKSEDVKPVTGSRASNSQSRIKSITDAGFEFPLIDDPTQVFQLFLGQDVDLIRYEVPRLDFEFDISKYFPIIGPLGATLSGNIGAAAQFSFGYDTRGLRQFVENDFDDPTLAFNGFYVGDLDSNGVDIPELQVYGGIAAYASVNLGIVQGGVGGGIEAVVEMNLHDGNDDGKLHIDEVEANLQAGKLFDLAGAITGFLEAFIKVDFFFFRKTYEFEIASFELIRFDNSSSGDTTPELAAVDNGKLRLNVGPFASQRTHGNRTDGDESITINQVGANSVDVTFDGHTVRYDNVSKVIVDGGAGDDTITVASNVDISVEIRGGEGNDVIRHEGSGSSTLIGGEGNDVVIAGSGVAIIFGEEGDDTITGGTAADFIDAGEGNDVVEAGAGDDTVDGGRGDDRITNSAGADSLVGGKGNDNITGGVDRDRIDGGDGKDTLHGGAGDDILNGGREEDLIDGGDGDDLLNGDDGNDVLRGQDGNDTMYGGLGSDRLDGNAGFDELFGELGNDFLNGGDDADLLYGGVGQDELRGENGDDQLYGEAAIDKLFGGEGNDTLDGGFGDDFVEAGAGDDSVRGGDGNDILAGDAGNDTIEGGDGDDLLFGSIYDVTPLTPGRDFTESVHEGNAWNGSVDGNDLIDGGDGDDAVFAGQGDDTVIGGEGTDSLRGGGGEDVFPVTIDLLDAENFDLISGGVEQDVIELRGTEGNDSFRLEQLPDEQLPGQPAMAVFRFDSFAADGSVVASSEFKLPADPRDRDVELIRISTLGGDDRVETVGPFNVNRLEIHGGDGNDTLIGSQGKDSILGGAGDDVIQGNEGEDIIRGGSGSDSIDAGADSDSVFGDEDNDTIDGGTGSDVVRGGSGNDLLKAGNGLEFNRLFGQEGNDTLVGGSGVDKLDGGADDDFVFGGDLGDILSGGDGNDTLVGEDGRDTIDGDDGDDLVLASVNNGIRSQAGVDDFVPSSLSELPYEDLLDLEFDMFQQRNELHASRTELQSIPASERTPEQQSELNSLLLERIPEIENTLAVINQIQTDLLNSNTIIVDNLDGGNGSDTLYGSAKVDNISGGDGDDTIVHVRNLDSVDAELDVILGGNGTDRYLIEGTEFADDILISLVTQAQTNPEVMVTIGSEPEVRASRLEIEVVAVKALSGDDTITVEFGQNAAMNVEIDAGDGDDVISAGELQIASTLQGGKGNDLIVAGLANDIIEGGSGDDTLTGGIGLDTIYGGDGNDIIDAGASNDHVFGGRGDDVIDAGAGNDIVHGNEDNDHIDGGDGQDTLRGDSGNDYLNGQGGSDNVQGGLGDDYVEGGLGNDTVRGNDGNDTVVGTSFFARVIEAESGTGIAVEYTTSVAPEASGSAGLQWNPEGTHNVNGTPGTSSVTYEFNVYDAGYYNISLRTIAPNGNDDSFWVRVQGTDTGTPYGGGWVLFDVPRSSDWRWRQVRDRGQSQVVPLYLTPGTHVLEIDAREDNTQLDQIYITNAPDTDTVHGDTGDDTIHVYNSKGTHDGGTGNDRVVIIGSDAEETILADRINAAHFNVSRTLQGSPTEFVTPIHNVERGTIYASNGDDTVTLGDMGHEVDFEVYGDNGHDSITGGSGNDTLHGGHGNDTFHGLAGDDLMFGGEENDLMHGGTGNDTIHGEGDNNTIYGGDGDDLLTGDYGRDHIYGENGRDTLHGGRYHDVLSGGEGDDTLYGDEVGQEFNDLLMGDEGNDIIYGRGGNDTIVGGIGDDSLHGEAGDDSIYGEEQADRDSVNHTANIAGQYAIVGSNGMNLRAPNGGGSTAYFDRMWIGGHEQWTIEKHGSKVAFRSANGHYLRSNKGVARPDVPHRLSHEMYTVVDAGNGQVAFRTHDGKYLTARTSNEIRADATSIGTHEKFTLARTNDTDDFIEGGDGNDIIYAQDGRDTVHGNGGNDTIHAGHGNDTVHGNAGDDNIKAGSQQDRVYGDDGNDLLAGNRGNDTMYGGKGNDTLQGGKNEDRLYGQDGNDSLKGGDGHDHLYGAAGNDYLLGEAGNDIYDGGSSTTETNFVEDGGGSDKMVNAFNLTHTGSYYFVVKATGSSEYFMILSSGSKWTLKNSTYRDIYINAFGLIEVTDGSLDQLTTVQWL